MKSSSHFKYNFKPSKGWEGHIEFNNKPSRESIIMDYKID